MKNNSRTMKFEEMERALANYDAMIGILKKQMEEGTNPEATPEVIAQFQQWRDHLEVRIGVERTRRLHLEDAKAPNAVRSAGRRVREYWNEDLSDRWGSIFIVATIIIGFALTIFYC